jgi:DNA-directed RNA polymerase specialized sigma24 family protein
MSEVAFSVTQRNEDVLEVLTWAVPLLRRLAFQFHLEYDELYQMAAEAALLNYEKALKTDAPRAFLYGVVRHVLWCKSDDFPVLSLDVPLFGDTDGCLADVVPAPVASETDEGEQARKEQALYASLRKLPLEVQTYLCRVYGLNAYQPELPEKGRFAGKRPNFSRDPGTLSRQAYSYLRRDRRLAHAICGTPLVQELDFERDYWGACEGSDQEQVFDFEREF